MKLYELCKSWIGDDRHSWRMWLCLWIGTRSRWMNTVPKDFTYSDFEKRSRTIIMLYCAEGWRILWCVVSGLLLLGLITLSWATPSIGYAGLMWCVSAWFGEALGIRYDRLYPAWVVEEFYSLIEIDRIKRSGENAVREEQVFFQKMQDPAIPKPSKIWSALIMTYLTRRGYGVFGYVRALQHVGGFRYVSRGASEIIQIEYAERIIIRRLIYAVMTILLMLGYYLANSAYYTHSILWLWGLGFVVLLAVTIMLQKKDGTRFHTTLLNRIMVM